MKVKIALIQMAMTDDLEDNLKKAVKLIRKAAKKGAQIVCLPEVFTSPYFPQEEKADTRKYEESIPGPSYHMLSKAAKDNNVILIGGSVYENFNNRKFNSAMIFDETGTFLGKYRKMHIPHDPNFYEQNYFEKGDLGYQVFQTKFGKIAVLICYDQWFPEAARIVSLMGADMIFYPTAIGTLDNVDQSEGNWQQAWEAVQRGHAIANGVIVAGVNRVGKESKTTFWGGSFIYSQFGTLLARGKDKEKIIIAEVETELGKDVKEGWRFFYNRRPETYGKLTER
ncbi:Nitrilase [Candidatus Bilamarchaeum dharawalense]|uniref:Nitrilase n=1 Tax=Candidatus Bilamarchaeum dharawalense TaxID=2885759 RepID=A0A5E4LMP3_9ARCH|nr:Nitrilase [Candidatus Bilamarchaeum dharawalense]